MLYGKQYTLPTAEILSGKNAWAWISLVSYLKKKIKLKYQNKKEILGAVQKMPAKQHSQSSQSLPKLGWISILMFSFIFLNIKLLTSFLNPLPNFLTRMFPRILNLLSVFQKVFFVLSFLKIEIKIDKKIPGFCFAFLTISLKKKKKFS